MSLVKKSYATFQVCKEKCKESYKQLDKKQQQHIDQAVKTTLDLYAKFKPYQSIILAKAKDVTLDDAINWLKMGTELLHRKEIIAMVEGYVVMLGDIVADKKRLRTYKKYFACLLDQMDPKIIDLAKTALTFLSLMFTVFSNNKNVKSAVGEVLTSINAELVEPLKKKVMTKLRVRKVAKH